MIYIQVRRGHQVGICLQYVLSRRSFVASAGIGTALSRKAEFIRPRRRPHERASRVIDARENRCQSISPVLCYGWQCRLETEPTTSAKVHHLPAMQAGPSCVSHVITNFLL